MVTWGNRLAGAPGAARPCRTREARAAEMALAGERLYGSVIPIAREAFDQTGTMSSWSVPASADGRAIPAQGTAYRDAELAYLSPRICPLLFPHPIQARGLPLPSFPSRGLLGIPALRKAIFTAPPSSFPGGLKAQHQLKGLKECRAKRKNLLCPGRQIASAWQKKSPQQDIFRPDSWQRSARSSHRAAQ